MLREDPVSLFVVWSPSMSVPTIPPRAVSRVDTARSGGDCMPRMLGSLRAHWPFPQAQVPPADWSRPLRDWVCWATAADFIDSGWQLPGSSRDADLPDWARPTAAARLLRELATESAIGSWTPGRLRRLHTQLAPSVPSVLRERGAWFGGSGADAPLQLAPTPETLPSLLEDLCEFIDWSAPDPLAQAALAHAQLLAIHPFADGNRRLARVVSAAIAVRGGIPAEALFPVFAMERRRGAAPNEFSARDGAALSALIEAWRDAYRRGIAFAGVLDAALAQCGARLADRLGGDVPAQRLLEIASARPIVDSHLLRTLAGAGDTAFAINSQALRDEGWVPIGNDSDPKPGLAGTRFWQRAAALWAMATSAAPFAGGEVRSFDDALALHAAMGVNRRADPAAQTPRRDARRPSGAAHPG
jgi:hypothetical protein